MNESKVSEVTVKNFTVIMPDGSVVGSQTKFTTNGVVKSITTEYEVLRLVRRIFLKMLHVKSFEEYNMPDDENPYGWDAIDWINSNMFLHYGKKQQDLYELFNKYPELTK